MSESTLESVTPSMPTWDTLEDWARSSIQTLLQDVLEEEVTQLLGTVRAMSAGLAWTAARARAMATANLDGCR